MANPQFNQQNLDTWVAQLQALPPAQKQPIQQQLQTNFVGYMMSQFTMDAIYTAALNNFTPDESQAAGMVASIGINTGNTFTATFPPEPPQSRACHKKFSVSGATDSTGKTTITATMEWSWD